MKTLRALPTLLALAFSLLLTPAQAGHHANHAPRPEQLQHIQGSLNVLRSALVRIGAEKQKEEFTSPIAEKSLLLEKAAEKQISEGDLSGAQQQLGLAMDIIKTAISTLRNHETLIRSLDFASPQDEYTYEKQRYQSYCMLADLLIKNKENPTAIQLRQQAEIIASVATQHASEMFFDKALKTQEESNRLVIQAIRRSGVFIPG